MEVLEAIGTRRSIRRYKANPVPEEELEKILEAGRWAPSASNAQPWKFIVISDPEVRRMVGRLFLFGPFLAEAPVGIAVVVDPRGSSCPVQDGTLATYAMMMAAHSLGLGTCWINPAANEDRVKELLGIPQDKRIICVISLGYPAEAPSKDRKRLEDIVFKERWGGK